MKALKTGIVAGLLGVSFFMMQPVRAEVAEVTLTRQPNIVNLASVLMEHDHLIEKQARAMGVGNLKVHWVTYTNGGAATDALLAGKVNFINSGLTNLLLLWDRTNGAVKGVASNAVVSEWLLTNNPAVKSVKDFSAKDRIAVPTVKVSVPAVILKMAAEQAFGPAGRDKLDPLTVGLGHPDAAIALMSGKSNIDAHFSAPPYQQQEIKKASVHKVLTSAQVFGGPLSVGVLFSTRQFHDANPKVYAAVLAALKEADGMIARNPRGAAQEYLATTHERYSVDDISSILASKENIFSITPYGTKKLADFMHKDRVLKKTPAHWQDVWFSEIHRLPGS